MSEQNRVKFWIGNYRNDGIIIVNREGMFIKLESGKIFSSKHHDLIYERDVQIFTDKDGRQTTTALEAPVKIQFQPYNQSNHKYTPQGGQYIEDVFPPSTGGFYGRIQSGTRNFLFIIQETDDVSRFWLTVADPLDGQIYEARAITPYEAETLSLMNNHEFKQKWYDQIWANIPKSQIEEVSSMLDDSQVSWSEISKLIDNISVPNFRIEKTMRETLSQLIPASFPVEIQQQLMMFFAFILKNQVPNNDPIDYLYKFWPYPMFGALLEGHFRCLVDGVEWPSYVKTLTLASRRHLDEPTKAIEKSVSESPWFLFWEKTVEQFPDWSGIAIGIVKELNNNGRVISRVPVRETTMKESIETWKKRLAILAYELRFVGRINPQIIGLTELVYFGAAYRWPHRHMKYITRLGISAANSPYLQVMIMPPSAAEQIKRVLPSVMGVEWTTRTLNLTLFNFKEKRWEIPTQKILSSFANKISLKRLKQQFRTGNQVETYAITKEEAKIADLATTGIRLALLERKEYLDPWGLDIKKVQSVLSRLSKKQVLQFNYEAVNDNLISLATIIQGTSEKVMSLCSSFLENTPTTLCMLGNNAKQAVLLSRIPELPAYELVIELPRAGLDQDMNIRCLRPTTFQSYTHNLYQRLLKDDETWDDDVSAFLSQARSKRKQLPESNA